MNVEIGAMNVVVLRYAEKDCGVVEMKMSVEADFVRVTSAQLWARNGYYDSVSLVWKNEALGNASGVNQQRYGVGMPVSENARLNGAQMSASPGLLGMCV